MRASSTIKIFRDRSGKYRWRCIAANGKIISASDFGYKTRRDVQRSIALTQQAVRV